MGTKWLGAILGFGIGVILMLGLYGFGSLLGVTSGEDFFSLGQFIVDVILMPTVIVTFLFTIYEFRKLQAAPDIDLFLYSAGFTKEGTLLKVANINRNSPQDLYLINSGDKIALWYMVEIRVPEYLDAHIDPEIGTLTDIRHRGEWTSEGKDGETVARFRCDGRYAVYPNYPLYIGHFNIQVPYDKKFQNDYKISYKIANDWGRPVMGTLQLRVIESVTGS